jgi:primosomal protein N' (replication factor Y)
MDTDTTQKKDSHTQILKDFQDGKAKVLIGTQMVAKGLDFPNVTLVGIINPDFLLNMPDYQSGERAYQLISQVGGRAGRGSEPGKVIIQTYDPDHYLFSSVIEQNYEEFYGKEISNRKILEYPPFYHLTRILVSGYNERQVIRTIELWTELLNKTINDMELNVEILGPVPAPLGLIKKRFRYHIIMKGVDLEALQNLARVIREKATEYSAEPRTIIDIEPQSLL